MRKLNLFYKYRLNICVFVFCELSLLSHALQIPAILPLQSIFGFFALERTSYDIRSEESFYSSHTPHHSYHPLSKEADLIYREDNSFQVQNEIEEQQYMVMQDVLRKFLDDIENYQLLDACKDDLAIHCEDIKFDEFDWGESMDKRLIKQSGTRNPPGNIEEAQHQLKSATIENGATSQMRYMKEVDVMISSIQCLQENEDILNQYCYHCLQESLLRQKLEENLQEELRKSHKLFENIFKNFLSSTKTDVNIINNEQVQEGPKGSNVSNKVDLNVNRKLHENANHPHRKKGKTFNKKTAKNDDKKNEITYSHLAYRSEENQGEDERYYNGTSMYFYYFNYLLGLSILVLFLVYESRKQRTFKRMWAVISNHSELREEMERKIHLQIPLKPPKKHFCLKFLTFIVILVVLIFVFNYFLTPYYDLSAIDGVLVILALFFILGCILYQNYKTTFGLPLPPQTVAVLPSSVLVSSANSSEGSDQNNEANGNSGKRLGENITSDSMALTKDKSNSSASPSIQKKKGNHDYSFQITNGNTSKVSYM